jgi:SAM-dependent methyltransferase
LTLTARAARGERIRRGSPAIRLLYPARPFRSAAKLEGTSISGEAGRAPRDGEAVALVKTSIEKYRRAHRRYERRHPEIFNPIEQDRLHAGLRLALSDIRTENVPPRALDLGCGSGNITRHLLELGASVVAADVSPEFLRKVERQFGRTGMVETFRLNGHDLTGIADASLDLVCAYSVLHHIPDYLGAIDDICRALAPGGIVYLDHEANYNFWDKESCFWQLLRATAEADLARKNWWNGRDWWHPDAKRWQRFLQPSRYAVKLRQQFDPAYPWGIEGDIHVRPGDHIEWDKIEERLVAGGCEVVRRLDYLNYSSDYPDAVWERFRGTCTNMRLTVARRM